MVDQLSAKWLESARAGTCGVWFTNCITSNPLAETRQSLRDQLLKLIVLQDWPRPRRELFALGVH